MLRLAALSLLLILTACAGVDMKTAPLELRPASFNDLPGWAADNQQEALAAFARSCAAILKRDPAASFGPAGGVYAAWRPPCRALPDAKDARAFFERWFAPYEATAGGAKDGLFTGYYEASLRGSLRRHGRYKYPLRLRPEDLVMVDLGEFRPELKGQRIAGRVVKGRLKPYEDRAAITAGKLAHDRKTIFVWVDDPVDAFFLQIQGSGRIALDGGKTLRVGYDAQNGWPYTAIGHELVARGDLTKDNVSMQSIRAWLAAHPDQAQDVMNTDKSYIFFKILDGAGPLGAEGVALTPGRSLAVDSTKIPYGVPAFVAADPPEDGYPPLQRLMVAQDTGGAIVGAVRGDVYWGYGPQAEELAGKMKAPGRLWLLLPKTATAQVGP